LAERIRDNLTPGREKFVEYLDFEENQHKQLSICNSRIILAMNFIDTIDRFSHDCEKHGDKKACSTVSMVERGWNRIVKKGLKKCIDRETMDHLDTIVKNAVESVNEVI